MVLIDLIYNLALLVALSVVSGFVEARWKRSTRLGVILQGVVFGGAAVIGMLRPFVFAPGLIFDGRSVMISLSGLFFGPWTAAVACLMTIPLRVAQGGPGEPMGVLVILVSAALGVGLHLHRRRQPAELSATTLLLFGLVVHLAMLALTVALPAAMILPVLKRIGWPVLLAYPLATVLIGKILADQAARAQFLVALQESERRFRAVFSSSYQFAGLLTPTGIVTEANQGVLDFAGITLAEALHRPFWETLWWRGDEARVRQLREGIARAARGEFVHYEVEIQGAGQATAIIDFSLKPIRDEGGRVTMLLPEGRDITERKRAEEQMGNQIAELRRWHEVTLGREQRVIALKREVNQLLAKTGQPPRYARVDGDDGTA
jgi:PAS domain S-box-containing protein